MRLRPGGRVSGHRGPGRPRSVPVPAPLDRGRPELACTGLRGHLATALGTAAAGLNAHVHVADPLTTLGALLADLGALAAGVPVMRGADQHEMSRGPADFGTSHHEAEMGRLDMLAACLKTVRHGRAETRLIAAQALVDAGAHFLAELVHAVSPENTAPFLGAEGAARRRDTTRRQTLKRPARSPAQASWLPR